MFSEDEIAASDGAQRYRVSQWRQGASGPMGLSAGPCVGLDVSRADDARLLCRRIKTI